MSEIIKNLASFLRSIDGSVPPIAGEIAANYSKVRTKPTYDVLFDQTFGRWLQSLKPAEKMAVEAVFNSSSALLGSLLKNDGGLTVFLRDNLKNSGAELSSRVWQKVREHVRQAPVSSEQQVERQKLLALPEEHFMVAILASLKHTAVSQTQQLRETLDKGTEFLTKYTQEHRKETRERKERRRLW